MQLALV